MGQPARYNMGDQENGNDHAFSQQNPVYHQPQVRTFPVHDRPVGISEQRPDILPTDPRNANYGCLHCRFHAIHSSNVPSIQGTSTGSHLLHSHQEDDSELLHANFMHEHFQSTTVRPLTPSWQNNVLPAVAPNELHELLPDSSDDDFSEYDFSSEGDFTENESYEELLRLDERLENPRGLGKQMIESLVSFEFNDDRHQGNQTSCVVCMFEFEPSELIRMLPCSHEFHAKCIDKWFQTKTTCPICRKNVSDCNTTSD